MSKKPPVEQTIRLSLTWLSIIGAGVLILGLVGGVLAQQLWRPNLPPLTGTGEKFVSTVQQVTISPNKAAAQTVAAADRSVVLLGQTVNNQTSFWGTGLIVTNDGLIVTTVTIPTNVAVQAFDNTGQPLNLERVGEDALYGLTYFRAPNTVLVPLDLSPEDASVGHTLLSISRAPQTFTSRAATYFVNQYEIPTETTPAALQKISLGSVIGGGDTLFTGSPLINDDTKVEGLVLDPAHGTSLPVSQLQASLSRLTNNQRENNPFTNLGLTLKPGFQAVQPNQPVAFVATVVATTPNSSAQEAGLQKGDIITAINDQPLDWSKSIELQLSEKLPLNVTFSRNGQSSTVSLKPVESPTPTPQ